MSNKQKRILCIVTALFMILSNIYPDCVWMNTDELAYLTWAYSSLQKGCNI